MVSMVEQGYISLYIWLSMTLFYYIVFMMAWSYVNWLVGLLWLVWWCVWWDVM